MAWVAVIGAGGAIAGGLIAKSGGGSSQTGTATTTNTATRDPRTDAILYGDNGQNGLLGQYQQLGQTQQMIGSDAYGQSAQNYLQNGAQTDVKALHDAAGGLMGSNISAPQSQAAMGAAAPQSQAATGQATMGQAAQVGPSSVAQYQPVAAPGQNNLDLSSAYSNLINGNAGANPYLTSALQSGVDQTNAAYQANQTSATDNLQRNVLSGIRSNSVLSGQYGGSRQGIAEGNAISDYTKQLANSNLQLGLANSANTTGAQAAAYNAGQDRSAAALNTLSGQQYGVASQNAAASSAAALANASMANSNTQQQAGLTQQTNLANQGAANQSTLANQSAQQQTNLANQGATQTSNLANQSAQQQTNLSNAGLLGQTNGLNSNNQQAGINAGSTLLNNQVGAAQNQDQYLLNRASQVNGLLSPYLGTNGNTTTQPLYTNTAGNVLGGASAGLGIASQLKGLLGNGQNIGSSGSYANNDYLTS